jgi:cysteinyl-tRNA synthetase, unknown class
VQPIGPLTAHLRAHGWRRPTASAIERAGGRMLWLLKQIVRLAVLAGLAAAIYGATLVQMPRPRLGPRAGPSIMEARTWGYQLQNAAPDRIASAIDVLVIDSQRSREPHTTVSPADVRRFKTRPDGRERIVLAYLSVGEAESYRYYWRSHWSFLRPSWLGAENAEWKGNFKVRFWQTGWQKILLDQRRSLFDVMFEMISEERKAYIDRILDAGFDGVYLDRVDIYEEWATEHSRAETDMIALVSALSGYAKARRPGFLIVPQNAEELLQHASYRGQIDAVGKEDLFFGISHSEDENPAKDVAASVAYLNRARADKLPVFVVEYLTSPEKRAWAAARAREHGFLLHYAARQLNRPPETLVLPLVPVVPTTARPKG